MIFVMDLPHGWKLYADNIGSQLTDVLPRFRNRNGQWRSAFEVARQFDGDAARDIFRAVKRYVDTMDVSKSAAIGDLAYRGADSAKFALEVTLKSCDRWTPDLRDTEIPDVRLYGYR